MTAISLEQANRMLEEAHDKLHKLRLRWIKISGSTQSLDPMFFKAKDIRAATSSMEEYLNQINTVQRNIDNYTKELADGTTIRNLFKQLKAI